MTPMVSPRPDARPDQLPVHPLAHGLGQAVEVIRQLGLPGAAQALRICGQHHQWGLEPMGQIGGPGARPLDGRVLGIEQGVDLLRHGQHLVGVVGWQAPHLEPTAFLESADVLSTTPLLIHCNYLEETAIARILASRASVVHCPRSHAYFGHDPHPVRQLLDAGVNIALGTDSLASNDSLSILDEMRFLHDHRRDLKVEEIFRMATLNGAAALHFGGVIGRLRRGYWADMTVLELPATACGRNLPRLILEGAGECIATVVSGEIAWQRDP